jgi:gliding motility-associated-like protein
MKRVQTNFGKLFFLKIFIFVCCAEINSQCITSFPYNEGFETVPSWTLAGANSDWTWGTPVHPTINSAGGGMKSWCVGGLNGSFYNNAEQASIVSPCFDFTNLSYPWISFKIFWECEFNYDGMVLQYSTNNGGSWINVGAYGDPNDCNTANWFNHNNISKLTSITTRHGWSGRIGATSAGCQGGNGSGGWVTAKHCLTGLANLPNVRFRFLFGSGTTCNNFDGIAIDDILISNGMSNVANFNYSCNGAGNFSFNALPAPCPVPGTFAWSFGDPLSASNTSTLQNPTHVFSAPGTYTVSLIVKGGQCNPPDTISKVIVVSNVSNAVSQNITCFGLNNGTASVSVSGNGPMVYNWSPSGGNNSQASNLSAGNYSVTITDGNNCTYTQTVSIAEPSALNLSVSDTKPSCGLSNGSATATANGGTGAYSYAWSPVGGNSSVATGLSSGNYSVTITDANNCTVSQNVNLTQTPALSLSVNSLTLCNNQVGAFTATVSGGTIPYFYNWNGTVTAVGTLTVMGDGIDSSFPVLVTDANGCISNSDTAKSSAVKPLMLNVSPSDTICFGATKTIFANASGGNGIYSYNWQPGGSSSSTYSVSSAVANVYSVNVTDGCGSSQTGTIGINIYAVPSSSFTASQTSGCQPLCISFSDPVLVAGRNITSWSWDFGDSTTVSTNPIPDHCFNKSGTFNVKLIFTTNHGCIGSQTINNYIKVFPKPEANFSADKFETDVYNTTIEFYNQTQNASYYNWFFGGEAFSGQQNPTYTFQHEGHYRVLLAAENSFGCIDTISKDVYIVPDFTFYAPNAFTPNGDGLNDLFYPKGAGWDPDKYELQIFDRWGESIFNTKNYNEGWDGKIKGRGEIAPSDVYVWKVNVTDVLGEQHQFTGQVTLNK